MQTHKRTPKSIQTEQTIREVARMLFSEKGYDQTTTKEIADCADCAEGTVFKYFPTKLDLLASVMLDFFTRATDTTSEAVNGTDDPFQQLRAYVQEYLRFMEAEWRLARIIVQYGRYGDDETLVTQFNQYSREHLVILNGILESLKSTGRIRTSTPLPLIRDLFFGSVEQFAMRHFPKKRPYDLDTYIDQLLDLMAFGFSTGWQPS